MSALQEYNYAIPSRYSQLTVQQKTQVNVDLLTGARHSSGNGNTHPGASPGDDKDISGLSGTNSMVFQPFPEENVIDNLLTILTMG